MDRIVSKLTFIKKLPRKIAKPLLSTIIIFDEIFWKLRISLFTLIFGKKIKIGKALNELKKTGFAIIPNFYSNSKILKIKEECLKQLDKLPFEKLKEKKNIDNLNVVIDGKDIRVEKFHMSMKVKGLHKINIFFEKIGRDFKSSLISLIYEFSLSKPFLIYHIVHDGSFHHPTMPKIADSEPIAGQTHVDCPIHRLRWGLLLDDVKDENGPTVLYKNSMSISEIKDNHLNLLLERFNFQSDNGGGHCVNEEKIKILEQKTNKIYVTGNRGDLVLLDLKTAHKATKINKGQRHILWFY